MKTIKIYGLGWVGKAMFILFPDALIHDPLQNCINETYTDISIICVPTPLKDEKLDCSIVEEVVKNCNSELILIRSTVMPGTCDYLEKKYNKKLCFQPEYLGETANHPFTDQKSRPFIIIGGHPENRRKIIELYHIAYNANITIRQVTNYEAEVIKLSENRAIAFKVAQCQELYDACEKAKIDYYTIRDAVYGDDPRFNLWFTFVYPEKRGFNSKCVLGDSQIEVMSEELGKNVVYSFEEFFNLFSKKKKDTVLDVSEKNIQTPSLNDNKQILSITRREYTGTLIHLRFNRKLFTCTLDHLLPVEREGKIITIRAKELLETDMLLIA